MTASAVRNNLCKIHLVSMGSSQEHGLHGLRHQERVLLLPFAEALRRLGELDLDHIIGRVAQRLEVFDPVASQLAQSRRVGRRRSGTPGVSEFGS